MILLHQETDGAPEDGRTATGRNCSIKTNPTSVTHYVIRASAAMRQAQRDRIENSGASNDIGYSSAEAGAGAGE
jgi:hypothetical protein